MVVACKKFSSWECPVDFDLMVAQLYQMQMLTHACQPGDSLVFHFSGRVLQTVQPG